MISTPGRMYSKTPKRTPMRRERQPPKDVDPVEVYCRVRPLDPDDDETTVEILSEDTIQLNPPKTSRAISKIEKMECTFKKVFTENDTQKGIFVQVGLPLIEDLVNGKSGLVFMYGITGSGKTYTMNGSPSNPGLLPRCLDVLFNSISEVQTERGVFRTDTHNGYELLSDSESKQERDKREKELKSRHYKELRRGNEMSDVIRVPDSTTLPIDDDRNYAVFISYVEIYNNFIYDLLDENQDAITKAPVSRSLREDADRNTYVVGATEVEVKTTDEAYDVFWNGQKRRRVAHTLLNAESSRSHSVFTIRLVQAPLDSSGQQVLQDKRFVLVSQLSLCDLAGSERTKRTENDGDRLKEAGNINNSLMTLRNCIESLRENQKAMESGNRLQIVPYRESKLTHLFKRHFEGEGKVRMIVCLNPKPEEFDESLHVMRFSEVTQEVKVARSEGAKFDIGLTPGRGKAHRLYKGVRDELEQVKSEFAEEVIPLRPLQRFESFPSLQMTSAEDSRTLFNLISYLQQRITLRNTLLTEQSRKEENLRSQLLSLQQENEDLCRALADQKSAYSDKDREILNLEKRIKNLNSKMMTVQSTVSRLEKDKREVETEAERYKKAYERERHEKHKVEKMLKHLTSSERSKWEMECNKRVKNKELEMQERYLKKTERLAQVKDIIQNFDSPVRTVHMDIPIEGEEAPPYIPPEPKPAPVRQHHRQVKEKVPPPVAKKPARTKPKTPSTERIHRSRSPPATTRKPDRREAPMRARHRRSRSSDCILVHKPTDTLETDTIMQPMIRNKKTVAIPKISDLKNELHYLLEHQEEDSAGEIETKLFKGAVMKTRTGGHSVQFTDIESLKHRSEGGVTTTAPSGNDTDGSPHRRGKKRPSSASEAVSDDSLTSIEGRCAVGIGGGPYGEPAQESKRKKH
ncbi:kinesin-like protein KIF23 isoform X2 [Rhopilema esculentum]|uniref:kinesin-like protein KIF23 isoform X2 n=1 Tax=Rhopilema esculentum TaxID=499914 RepID=UPI0031DAE3F2